MDCKCVERGYRGWFEKVPNSEGIWWTEKEFMGLKKWECGWREGQRGRM